MASAADICARAVAGLDGSGRPLGAANAALPPSEDPLVRLWQSATVLREHRGDGHVAALVGAGLDGCEALVLRAGCDLDRTVLQPARGWTDAEWDAAVTRVAEMGLVSRDGSATDAGRTLVRQVEDLTDALAAPPWRRLGEHATDRLTELLAPIASAAAAGLPYPNPIGLPRPASADSSSA